MACRIGSFYASLTMVPFVHESSTKSILCCRGLLQPILGTIKSPASSPRRAEVLVLLPHPVWIFICSTSLDYWPVHGQVLLEVLGLAQYLTIHHQRSFKMEQQWHPIRPPYYLRSTSTQSSLCKRMLLTKLNTQISAYEERRNELLASAPPDCQIYLRSGIPLPAPPKDHELVAETINGNEVSQCEYSVS